MLVTFSKGNTSDPSCIELVTARVLRFGTLRTLMAMLGKLLIHGCWVLPSATIYFETNKRIREMYPTFHGKSNC